MDSSGALYFQFLDKVKDAIVRRSSSEDFTKLSGDEWETLVFEQCLLTNEEESLGWVITNTKPAEFPDIVINSTFGVEVKVTKDDHWTTLGNSINESRRISTVENVYFFFGKLGGVFEIKFKPYEKCLKNIATTHYPRYIVDMMLDDGLAIFDKLGITYNDYRNLSGDERIKLIKDYLRKNLSEGEALWWIDETTPPVIRNFNKFDSKTRKEFTVLAMARCPEIFKHKREKGKYDRVAELLLTEYQAVSTNLRDHFSASGTVSITLNAGGTYRVPQMVFQLHSSAHEVRAQLLSSTAGELFVDWGLDSHEGSVVDAYAELLNQIGDFQVNGLGTGDIFLDGLK